MAGGFLDSLMSSFGGVSEGPDPTRLEGLLQYARERLDQPEAGDELMGHVNQMRARIQATLRDRQSSYDGRRSALHADVCASIERNLAACQAVDAALGEFLEQPSAQVLEQYERSVREFFETSDVLTRMAHSEQPLCPACGSSGPEPGCPACQVDRLIPDSEFAEEDFEQAVVNEEFMAVFRAYQAVVEGRGRLAELIDYLQPLEFSLMEAQALVEQSLADEPDDPDRQTLLNAVNNALEGVHRMHAVEQNRLTRELHQGWLAVFRGAKALSEILPRLQ